MAMVGDTLEIKSLQSIELLKDLFLRLILRSFKGRGKSSFPIVDPDLGY